MQEIITPVGRLVSGHPMVSHPVMDDKVRPPVPKLNSDGTPMVSYYFGIAIPKGTEQHWNQTEWGGKIWNEAITSWPNGEYNAPTFAWKIDDGDSQIPNKRGIKPCDREGWPGHWIIHCSNGFAVKCHHRGMYEAHQVMQNKEAIKPGDYIRAVISVKGNEARHPNTPGLYMNPSLFELYQAGIEIVISSGPSAAETFGAVQGALPAGAQVDPNVTGQPQRQYPPAQQQQPGQAAPPPAVTQPAMDYVAPPPAVTQPAMDYVAPPPAVTQPAQQQQPGQAAPPPAVQTVMYVAPDGSRHTKEALIASGWNEQWIASLQTV